MVIIRQKIGQRFTKKLVIIRQKIGQRFTKKLVVHLPKFWLFICQNFGCSFAKILVIDLWRPRSFAKGCFHLPKNWSEICQKIGQRFAKKLVRDLPKFWSFICQKIGQRFTKKLVVDSPKNWSEICQKIGKLIRQNFGCSRLSLAKILVAKQMIDIFQFLEHNPAYILPIYNQEPLTKYQLKQLTQYEQNK